MKDWLLPTGLALFAWMFWGFLPKLAARHINAQSAMVYQVLGGLVIGLAVLINLKFKVDFNVPGMLYGLVIGLLGFFGALMYLIAASKGPLALVAPITALYPMGVILLSFLILGETITTRQGFGIGLPLVSIYLIST
jgi:uncharacterized membrane protein